MDCFRALLSFLCFKIFVGAEIQCVNDSECPTENICGFHNCPSVGSLISPQTNDCCTTSDIQQNSFYSLKGWQRRMGEYCQGGYDFYNLDLKSCQDFCESRVSCIFYIFDIASQTCTAFESLPTMCSYSADHISGKKRAFVSGYRIRPGFCVMDHNILSYDFKSLSFCEHECTMNSECLLFEYNSFDCKIQDVVSDGACTDDSYAVYEKSQAGFWGTFELCVDSGTSATNVSTATYEECMGQCGSECSSFTYSENESKCYIYSSLPAHSVSCSDNYVYYEKTSNESAEGENNDYGKVEGEVLLVSLISMGTVLLYFMVEFLIQQMPPEIWTYELTLFSLYILNVFDVITDIGLLFILDHFDFSWEFMFFITSVSIGAGIFIILFWKFLLEEICGGTSFGVWARDRGVWRIFLMASLLLCSPVYLNLLNSHFFPLACIYPITSKRYHRWSIISVFSQNLPSLFFCYFTVNETEMRAFPCISAIFSFFAICLRLRSAEEFGMKSRAIMSIFIPFEVEREYQRSPWLHKHFFANAINDFLPEFNQARVFDLRFQKYGIDVFFDVESSEASLTRMRLHESLQKIIDNMYDFLETTVVQFIVDDRFVKIEYYDTEENVYSTNFDDSEFQTPQLASFRLDSYPGESLNPNKPGTIRDKDGAFILDSLPPQPRTISARGHTLKRYNTRLPTLHLKLSGDSIEEKFEFDHGRRHSPVIELTPSPVIQPKRKPEDFVLKRDPVRQRKKRSESTSLINDPYHGTVPPWRRGKSDSNSGSPLSKDAQQSSDKAVEFLTWLDDKEHPTGKEDKNFLQAGGSRFPTFAKSKPSSRKRPSRSAPT